MPIIEHRSVENQFEIFKTKRYISFNKEKAETYYGKANIQYFEGHLSKLYRYYIKHPVWEGIKTSVYRARPWNTDKKDISI